MAATYTSLILCVLVCLPLLVIGEVCTSPQVTDKKVYTTEDAFTATDTAFIIEFTLSCKNGAKVSWTDEHQKSSRTYVINFYDEDGFSALRKAQRSGEDASAVKPLFVISFDHKGVSSGPYVSTEVLATMTGFLVWYLAYSAKSKIQA
ncbi:translocon-associated protein subunit delta-like isoform X2 [Ptychodera flava]|uniref:translocon-associated protein subunit delta-like isoform X2 n=1 Tax=Ptychodera flava TaxID=63121 RepID=UPI003969FF30